VPPRPHRLLALSAALACAAIALLALPHEAWPRGGPRATRPTPPRVAWHWPLRGRVVGAFRLTPHTPFARGQRRGVDLSAAPGTAVRAACPGRVTFAGPLPRQGLGVTVRCGELAATYLRLGRLFVRRGARVARGERLATLGRSGRLRLGARRAADRHGYLDPLTLLGDDAPTAPPLLGPAPRPRRPRHAPPPRLAPTPAPTRGEPRRLPWPAYPALALIATALPLGGLVHRRRRHGAAVGAAAAAHKGP
jgi:hypothetical protein